MSKLKRRQFLKTLGTSAAAVPAAAILSRARGEESSAGRPKIKIGQIGTAHAHAGSVLNSLREMSDDFQIVGVVENDPERRRALGGSYQGVPLITEEELLATDGLQAVAVETAVGDLVPTAMRSVRAGMHVHLDKPAGESLAEYKNLLDEAAQRGRTVQMGYIYRYNPAVQFCLRAVRDGWLGDVFEVHAVISKSVDDGARKQLARFEGGTMFELGCHVIDLVVSVLGPPQRVTPYARRTRAPQDMLADNQLAVFEFTKATATVRSAVVEVEGFQRRQLTVCGERGTFDHKPLAGTSFRLALDRPRGSYKKGYQDVKLPAGPGGFTGHFRDLAAIIRGEKESDFPPAHDLAVHEAVLAASYA